MTGVIPFSCEHLYFLDLECFDDAGIVENSRLLTNDGVLRRQSENLREHSEPIRSDT